MNIFDKFEKIVYDNDLDAFKEEVSKLDDINIQNKYGWTLLHVSIRRDRVEMVHYLLDNSADINKVDGVGWTPLMEAIMDDMPNLCKLLVEKGADKSIANARGVTAPMLAQKFGRADMYEFLN